MDILQHRVCFNPCFNGYSTLTKEGFNLIISRNPRFNPCFNGYSTLTIKFYGYTC